MEIKNLNLRYENLRPNITLKLKGKGFPSYDEPWNLQYPKLDKDMISTEMSMYRYLKESTKDYLDEIAIIYEIKGKQVEITFRELIENIDKAAKAFKACGVKEGEIVTIMSLTTPETIYSFYALNKIGATVFMMDLRKGSSEYEKQLNDTNTKTLLIADFLEERVKKIINNTEVENIIKLPYLSTKTLKELFQLKKNSESTSKEEVSREGKIKYKKSVLEWKKFIKKGDCLFGKLEIEVPFKPNKSALMILTSGTSGSPKIVEHTSETVNAMPQKYYKTGTFVATPKEKMLTVMPPFLMYAVPLTFQTALTNGVTLVVCPKVDSRTLPKLLEQYRPEYFIGAPSHFYDIQILDEMSYSKYYGCGGDRVNKNVEKSLKQSIHNMFIGYGATEMGGSVATQTPAHNELGTVGLPLYGNKVVAVNPETYEEVDYDEIGLLCWQNDTTMLGYYKDHKKTSEVFVKDEAGNIYFNSGDIGIIHKTGDLEVIGRIKPRAALFTGHKFSTDNITEELLKHPNVRECLTVAQQDTYHKLNGEDDKCQGQWPHSYIVLNSIDNVYDKIDSIKQWALNQLGEQDVPFFYTVVDKLKLTNNGKVDYRYYENETIIINKDGTVEANEENGLIIPDYDTLTRDSGIKLVK